MLNFDGSPLPELDSAHSPEWLALVAAVEADLGPAEAPEVDFDMVAELARDRHEARILRRLRRTDKAARAEYRADRARTAFDRLPADVAAYELDRMREERIAARAAKKQPLRN
jgi:hypothetical protein